MRSETDTSQLPPLPEATRDMIKRFTNLHGAKGCRHWVAALVTVVAAGNAPAAYAQSTLRFVDAPTSVTSSTTVVMSPVVDSAESAATELRFVVESQETPVARSTPSPAPIASTIALKPSTTKPAPIAPPAATELRFAVEPQVAIPQATALTLQPAPQAVSVPAGTELFGSPSQLRELQPRAVAAFSHVPAAAPQNIAATPVRVAPAQIQPPTAAGTELFVSAPAKKWDVPALDYGAALKSAKPEPNVAAPVPAPRVIVANRVPTAVTIKPAPMPVATELFTAMPQPQSQPPTQNSKPQVAAALPPAPVVVAPQIVQAPKVAPTPRIESRPIQPVAQPQIAVATPAPAPTKQPVATPIGSELFASAPVKPMAPAAAELDFSRVPVRVETPKPQFAATAAAPPVTAPIVAAPVAPPVFAAAPVQPPVQQLVPAVVPPTTSAVASTPTHQVVVSQEPEEPNVYKFRFAATMDEAHTSLVQNVGPEAVEPAVTVPEALPADLTGAPCGCNQGGMGGYGCPYLPGQSGTRNLCGVDCGRCGAPCSSTWSDAQCIPWSLFGPGEYVGPARPAHVDTYYLRVNDFITLTFIESRKKSSEHYRIGVGDRLQIEWLQGAGNAELPLNRELLVQPDGTVTLPLIGEVNASGKTINDFRDEVVKLYSKYQRDPQITVTPISVNVAVQDLLKAVTAKNQSSGQTQDLRVAPDGTIQAAGIGNVYVQGLTLDELRSEIEARYVQAYGPGITVSPQLTDRAVSYVFLGGEVKAPGRYTLEGPTTVMQAIAMAGGWNIGGNVRQVVVFRRDENWCLKATKIDVRAPLYGNDPCPMNDVWLRENDLVLVPKQKILCATDMINLYFTRGVYAVFPISYVYDFSQNSGIVPVP
jgi:polysaccharide export outer membrane protein